MCAHRTCVFQSVISVVFAPRRAHSGVTPSVTWKNIPFIYLARAPWYFGALFAFFVLFHATLHALAKWGGQSDNSNFWLKLLYPRVCCLSPVTPNLLCVVAKSELGLLFIFDGSLCLLISKKYIYIYLYMPFKKQISR